MTKIDLDNRYQLIFWEGLHNKCKNCGFTKEAHYGNDQFCRFNKDNVMTTNKKTNLGLFVHYKDTVYNVYANSDMIEGRGSQVLIGSFDSSLEANLRADGRGVMGSKANVELETVTIAVPISGTEDWTKAKIIEVKGQLNPEDPKKKREAILNKLTPEEQEYLGLTK